MKLTPYQHEIVLEALERHLTRTRKLRESAGVRGYSTKDKHDNTMRELRKLIDSLRR